MNDKNQLQVLSETILHEVEDLGDSLERTIANYRKPVMRKFPFLIIGLSAFGIVAINYSFEKIIDSIPFLADRPLWIFLAGFIALIATGTLYKKLS